MAQTAESILKDLKSGKFAPIYFLSGTEPFYIDSIAEYIEENALTEAERGFNQTILYGKDISMQHVLDGARRFPMMAQRQIIVVKEAQELSDLNKDEFQKKLIGYCETPVPSTVLVFCYKHKKLDKRKALYKALDKHTILLNSEKIKDYKLGEWIQSYCANIGQPIDSNAVRVLGEYIGNNLNRIANELKKVKLSNPNAEKITEDMIVKHVGISKEYNIFELQKALAARDPLKANQIIGYFSANPKENPLIQVISFLFSFFSKVLIAHQHKNQGPRELMQVLGLSNVYFVQEYQQACRNYPLHKSVQIINHLHQADLQSKGVDSVADDSQILKELIYKILH